MNDVYEVAGSIEAAAHLNSDTIDQNIRLSDGRNIKHEFDGHSSR